MGSRLTAAKQRKFLQILEQGGSPSFACLQLKVTYRTFLLAMQNDEAFRRRCDEIDSSLGHNVVSALYRSAMQGSVTAQTFWLKNHPPAGWGAPLDEEQQSELDQLKQMNDDELIELARTMGIDPTHPTGRRTGSPQSSDGSAGVSPPADLD